MERREQYDPEDIESLLQERGFDELLEEERAYVLRHLSGREEYEQMRALLHQVRDNDREFAPIEADELVRMNVMQAFRSQQQPQWKIWLNSIGAIFTPGEGSAMWRPALAIGSIVLLFGLGIYLVRGPIAGDQQELAEVRRQKADEPLPRKTSEVEETDQALIPSVKSDTFPGDPAAEKRSRSSGDLTPAMASAMEKMEPTDGVQIEEHAIENKMTELEIHSTAPTSGHVVTEFELARNQSMANVSGKVPARASKESANDGGADGYPLSHSNASSRSVAEDPALLDLLSAGW